ncbi:MAG: hypothetical protein PHO62_08060 [Sulfurimonas sp.]|uniref:hypothetical protein n=1 Tax=Sulfurimonas sp. TaxID=2022749 RepID=UPI00260F64BB|nr:hypothetical protein [Sulfurimonas sp.]MDD5373362.1 hypothetical protein [Sulfurimonas sp.]
MKKIIAIILTAASLNACVCAPQLTSAFQSITTHIVGQNLVPIKNSLENLNKSVEDNIDALKAQKPLIKKSNDVYMEKIIEARKILFKLEQETREVTTSREKPKKLPSF